MPSGTPQQIASILRRRALQFERQVREADKLAAEKGVALARQYSSGSFKSAQLRKMGHPYRIGGSPPQDAAIVNRQSGDFFAKWRFTGPRKTSKGLVTRILNDSPHARLLARGTRRMIARPLLVRLRTPLTVLRKRYLKQAMQSALKT